MINEQCRMVNEQVKERKFDLQERLKQKENTSQL